MHTYVYISVIYGIECKTKIETKIETKTKTNKKSTKVQMIKWRLKTTNNAGNFSYK